MVFAQSEATGIPYSCGFEEDEDLSCWVMNYNTPNARDKWVIGTQTHSDGKRSLYISADGTNPNYGTKPNIVASYLRFKFPTATEQKDYDISFDWRGMGDSTDSKLYVMVCPEILLTHNAPNNNYNLDNIVKDNYGIISPTLVNQVCQQLGESKERFVCGGAQWQNVALSNKVSISSGNSKYTFAIVFIWVNNNSDEQTHRTGICIDNVQIGSALLKKPQKMSVEAVCEDSTMLVSWESGLTKFEVQYRAVGSATWRRADGIINGVDGFTRVDGTHCSYVLHRIMEGSYDVRVRGISGDVSTNFVYKNNVLVYCPENHCINYIDLYSENVVCTYGYHPLKTGATPYDEIGVIDFGPGEQDSRHTIHVDPTEVDPRTDDGLRTVPPGALASVRLGNWKNGAEAESITYSIQVDSANQGLLIVKYAVVLQNPQSGHTHEQEPSFLMEVIDENGNLIDESCGRAEFSYSDAVEAGWNLTKDGNVAWKDWTTIGVNMQPYNGQVVKLRFTTFDCSQSGHYGYAYFTVDCASAHLETDNCGNDAKITCYAPDGFSYKWFNEAGLVVSTDRELVVDPSRQEYTCRVSFVEDPSCYFEVSTVSSPRFPVPSYNVQPIYEECLSKLKFTNTSHVMTKFDGEENHTAEPCEDFHWYFRLLSDGTTTESYNPSPIFLCPEDGDSIEVTYTCYIGADNSCDSVRVDTIYVPSIHPEDTEFFYETCPETPVFFDGKWFERDTTYVTMYPNFAGCDSTSTMHLKVWPKVKDTYRHDSICSDMNLIINGDSYNQPMENQLFMMKTIHGCDSAVYVTLTVNEKLQKKMEPYSYSCADDGSFYIAFDISAGQYDSLQIKFDTPTLRDTTIFDPSVETVLIPFPDTIRPGKYMATLTFYQFCCGMQKEQRAIVIRYRSSIVEQKWNDVLTLLSPEYNGGYVFSGIQWYKNGQLLDGETHPYLYQPLDFSAEYEALLTLEDGLSVFTCPIQPVYHEQQTQFPTIVQAGQKMPVYMDYPTTVWYYTVAGQLYSTFTLPAGYSTMDFPMQHGVYVLKATNQRGESQAQVMIVE